MVPRQQHGHKLQTVVSEVEVEALQSVEVVVEVTLVVVVLIAQEVVLYQTVVVEVVPSL